MIPYAFGSSDGLFNLGSALSFVQVLPPGVYIAMNGRCFEWDRRAEESRDRNVRGELVGVSRASRADVRIRASRRD